LSAFILVKGRSKKIEVNSIRADRESNNILETNKLVNSTQAFKILFIGYYFKS